jgi:hypothetical protein
MGLGLALPSCMSMGLAFCLRMGLGFAFMYEHGFGSWVALIIIRSLGLALPEFGAQV